jgi:dTMP kinase
VQADEIVQDAVSTAYAYRDRDTKPELSGPTGVLITLDGQSGIGKTTVAALIRDRLDALGQRVLLTGTPSLSAIGALARTGTFDFHGLELTLLVAADRYHHERTVIRPALMTGAVVVCDRYVASSLVLDPFDGVDRGAVWQIYRRIVPPNLSIILRGDPVRCFARAAARGLYSRFHIADRAANSRELAAFVEAAGFLRTAGYQVVEHDIGDATANDVADQLTALIVDVKGGRR